MNGVEAGQASQVDEGMGDHLISVLQWDTLLARHYVCDLKIHKIIHHTPNWLKLTTVIIVLDSLIFIIKNEDG